MQIANARVNFPVTARTRIGPGAFAIACIYLYEGTEGEYSHWITLGHGNTTNLGV